VRSRLPDYAGADIVKCVVCNAWLTDAGMDVKLCALVDTTNGATMVSIVDSGDERFEVHHD
jgi:hypothetical protein